MSTILKVEKNAEKYVRNVRHSFLILQLYNKILTISELYLYLQEAVIKGTV